MVSGDGPKLARVSYLPGVMPPPSPEINAAGATAAEPQTSPDFVSFFGDSGNGASGNGDSGAGDSGNGDSDGADSHRAESSSADLSSADLSSAGAGTGNKRREVRAENVSMHALTRRGMSRWELEKTLLSRELDGEVVEAELDRLEGVGLLDDAALAETFVRTQHDRKGLGRGAITAELRRRHIAQEHIDAALAQVDDDDEQTRATELAVKRAGQLSSYDLETAKRRLHGFLSRKGYSSAVVRAAIDEALSPRSSGVRFR